MLCHVQVVEEFMSLTDGQTVLRCGDGGGGASGAGVSVDAALSVSRIGTRAFPPALEALAPQIRCRPPLCGSAII